MQITKYLQSCLVLATAGGRVVIDPGSITLAQFKWADFGKLDAVLYTHQHFDHFVADSLAELSAEVPIYANADVAALAEPGRIQVIIDGQTWQAGPFKVKAHDLAHCLMQDGSEGPPNTGFIFDGWFFHPGDGIATEGVKVPVMALPIAGPSIDLKNAAAFAVQVGASEVIPVHYDGRFKADAAAFAAQNPDLIVRPLEAGASVELNWPDGA